MEFKLEVLLHKMELNVWNLDYLTINWRKIRVKCNKPAVAMSVCGGTDVKGCWGWEGGERVHVEHEFGELTNRCPGFWSHDVSCDRSLAAASTRVSNSRVALQWQRI